MAWTQWADSIGVNAKAKVVKSWYSKDILGNTDEDTMLLEPL